MSQLVATAHTSADSIPLGRRIAEIMHEKGQAYSITTMAKRLGFNRETFRLMLKGDREIYSYELDRIAQDLKVPVERILQNDVLKESRELKGLLQNLSDKNRALELANVLFECAIGLTERCYALNHLGSALYLVRDYDRAHQTWNRASEGAKMIQDRYGEPKLLLRTTANLTLTYTIRKEYSNMYEIIKNTEPFLDEDPVISGVIFYSIAKIKEQQGEFDEARDKLGKSLSYAHQTNNLLVCARAKHNLAAFEYRRKNYRAAVEYFELAIQDYEMTQEAFGLILCLKEYAKVLLKLSDNKRAESAIVFAIEKISLVETENFLDMESQLYLLLSITRNDPQYAEKVIFSEDINVRIRKIAGKFLVDYYNQIGDLLTMSKYHKVVNGLQKAPYDILHEEDL